MSRPPLLQLFGLPGLIALYLSATTYPYDRLQNGATLVSGEARFHEPGIVQWREPIAWDRAELGAQGLHLSMEVTADRTSQHGPARILTISRDHYHSNVTIGQEGADLIVRLRREPSEPLGVPPYVAEGVFVDASKHAIVVSVTRDQLVISVDGETRLLESLEADPFQFWQSDYPLALGNELTWQRPWLGVIASARLRTASVDIDLLDTGAMVLAGFPELLAERFSLVSESVLDVALNFAAMIPLGFLSLVLVPRLGVAPVLLVWLLVSVSAEAMQVVIVSRHPSLSDVVLNLLGAWTGTAAASRWRSARAS